MSVFGRRRGFIVWTYGVLIAVLSLAVCFPVSSIAQDDSAPGAAAATDAAQPPAAGSDAPPPPQSALAWLVHTSGWIGGVLLLMSFYFVALIIQCFLELRPQMVAPPDLVEELEALLAKRDFQGIYRAAKDSPTGLGQLVASGLAALSGGFAEAREAIDRAGESITVEMEKRISMLAVIGSLGPLIGLLGTLKGMISSFSVIARSETQLKPSEVAGGISEALLITFEGVALSVPAIFFFAFFKNRVASLSLHAITTADDFLKRVHGGAQSRPAAPATPKA